MLPIPTSAQSLCLALTYQRLPGSSPTSSVPSPGWCPPAVRAPTRVRSSSRIAAAVTLPSRIVAGTTDSLPERRHDRVAVLGSGDERPLLTGHARGHGLRR